MARSQLDDVKPTFITYPTGSCREEASVLAVLETPRENGRVVAVTDVSPFHPHLLAYALNEATHGLWRKETGTDSRGHHDLDAATCVLTRHDEGGSLDRYRLGKSLRKRGFDVARFLDELPGIVERTNGTLAHWITSDAPVRVDCLGPRLTDRRQWVCETPGGTAQMPCGGTHVERLGQIASMTAQASYDADGGILTIRNEVRTHPAAR
ncbi:hypothetical protein [Kitasatospora sp. NPDC057500]|uniref:hypothetical protein n=1 Tax=Kitasatospora sp. NPDC057500 TaxID=3346151 RepID=UPI00367ADC7C